MAEINPIFKTTDEINSDVESFLSSYHSSFSFPIPIEEIIEFKLGIDIISIPGLKDSAETAGFDIDAFISSDFKSITVDRHIQYNVPNRYRFTLAHEIAHMVLHGYLYAQFDFSNSDEWISAINEMPLLKRGMQS